MMLGFAVVPSVIQLIGFIFLPESPRYLYSVGKHKDAKEVLKRIYAGNEVWAQFTYTQIDVAHEQEQYSKAQTGSMQIQDENVLKIHRKG
ncbi:unnamed protein product [Gongylonema pulchrum]|uniref:MFS domain-containing protein n=1 Tax=Gongylonema pulchrum TaxID=637853 RepID=A0A3P6PSM7_9BILA|nr:unnamed protein product [Gongylonema pulchrum]